ncbi:MAG: excalibur calcium-binding domain-containing protein [Ardenticatenia bacterium]|nr:excalibur calcium-binding domain-containing protein [Ardenticatenia bacterium]
MGKEGRDDWIVISRFEQEAPIHISPPEPPGKVSLSAESARYPVEAAPTESGIAEAAAPPYRVRVAQTPTTTTPITTQTQAPANSALAQLLAFVRRHPVVSLLILLLFLAQPMLVILPGALVWLSRLFRIGSLQPVTRFAGQHKAGMLITSGLAGASVMALAAITGSPSAEERSVPAVAPAVAPAATATVDNAAAPSAEAATATERATSTTAPPTLTATETSMPPTSTPVPPTPLPPTAAPPIDINPNQDQNCDSFPDYQTMSAWRGYWIARGIRNPGRLDGDGDGKACEDGEGGRPAAAPHRRRFTNVAPPPPVDWGRRGRQGCCKTCTGQVKPVATAASRSARPVTRGAGLRLFQGVDPQARSTVPPHLEDSPGHLERNRSSCNRNPSTADRLLDR